MVFSEHLGPAILNTDERISVTACPLDKCLQILSEIPIQSFDWVDRVDRSIPDISLMISQKKQIYQNIFFVWYLMSISANWQSLPCICFWFVVVLCAPLDLRSEGRINQLLKVLRFVYLAQAVAWRRCRVLTILRHSLVLIQTNYMCLLGDSDVM